jgi:hypothetical protein
MRKRLITILLLGSLVVLPVLLAGCGNGSDAFRLGDCRLGDVDCRLQ